MEEQEIENLSWIELGREKDKTEGHTLITDIVRDLGNLGYRIKSVNYENGMINISCYRPQYNEGSEEVKV